MTSVSDEYARQAARPNAVLWSMAPSGQIVEISPSIEVVRGYTVDEALAHGPAEMLTPASLHTSLQYFETMSVEILAGRTVPPFQGQMEYLCKDGSTVVCDVYAEPIFDADGQMTELRGVSSPLTD